MMNAWGWFLLVFFTAVLDWFATWKKKERWRLVTKPLPMALLALGIVLFRPGVPFPIYLFLTGLVLGLAGDIFLLFKGDVVFILGLLAFLLGHLSYIIGLNVADVQTSFWNLVLLIPVAGELVYFQGWIIPHVEKKMRIAVWIYAIILVSMFYSALLTTVRDEWVVPAILCAVIGSASFVVSDTMLAYDRFVRQKFGVWVMVTYHLAQIGIIAAAFLQYP